MSKEFKKDQVVVTFSSVDHKGTWKYTRAVVKSCGAKKMTLINAETGAMMGSNFQPNSARTSVVSYEGKEVVQNLSCFTLADMSDEEAVLVCLEHAALTIADKNASFDECIKSNASNEGYCKNIEENRAELHEPRAIKR